MTKSDISKEYIKKKNVRIDVQEKYELLQLAYLFLEEKYNKLKKKQNKV